MTDDDPTIDAPSPATCTFTAEELDVPWFLDILSLLGDDPADVGCSRPVWEGADSDRCVWHAKQERKPPDELSAMVGDGDLIGVHVPTTNLTSIPFPEDSKLVGADLSWADLPHTDLSGANLLGADLSGANLDSIDLSDSDIRNADLSGAYLWKADLSGADLREANLTEANLHEADLSEANLRQAILDRVGLYDTELQNVDIDEGTTTRPPSLWELHADAEAESGIFGRAGLRRLRALNRSASDSKDLKWAEQQYRRIERLYRENDFTSNSALTVQEKHARRKRALAEGNRLLWLRRAFSRWILGYGILIRPIIGLMLVVIVGCALVYPLLGFEDGSLAVSAGETVTVAYGKVPPPFSWETVETFGRSLYFSTITFSTLGYADVFPTGWTRGLATVEAFIGALLMAYFVSVLSRRAIR